MGALFRQDLPGLYWRSLYPTPRPQTLIETNLAKSYKPNTVHCNQCHFSVIDVSYDVFITYLRRKPGK